MSTNRAVHRAAGVVGAARDLAVAEPVEESVEQVDARVDQAAAAAGALAAQQRVRGYRPVVDPALAELEARQRTESAALEHRLDQPGDGEEAADRPTASTAPASAPGRRRGRRGPADPAIGHFEL